MTHEDAMGHGGHAGMSMQDMERDMRSRFLVAAVLSVPILLWSPIGRDVLGFDAAAPFGLRDDVWSLLLTCRSSSTRRGSSLLAHGERCVPGRWT
jgi:Cu2+-exporting ATPase